jgi:MFS family permease
MSVLLSAALLITGHGLQLTLLPLQAHTLGWSSDLIGLTGATYYLGFVLGCLFIPRVIRQVGHIRTFTVFVSIACISVVIAESIPHWLVWTHVRLASGLAMAGIYTVVESWLNERVAQRCRGSIMAIYTTLSLGAMVAGQMLVGFSELPLGTLFSIAITFIVVATIPIGLTAQAQPVPPQDVSFNWRTIYTASQVGVVCAALSGVVVGLTWSMGAVFAVKAIGTVEAGSHFMLLSLLGGFMTQYPAGRLSDYLDRRYVVLGLAVLGSIGAIVALTATGGSTFSIYCAAFLSGAGAMPLYSICVAHANDNEQGNFLEIASGMLIANALGSIAGPVSYSVLLRYTPDAYMLIICASFIGCVLWTLYRLTVHQVARACYAPYQPLPKTTTNAIPLDPRVDPADLLANEAQVVKE